MAKQSLSEKGSELHKWTDTLGENKCHPFLKGRLLI